ncbi:MAG TPA: hypothetical protein VMH83_07635 [Candidatus Acidoferrum sp.]|nr:hypothetical protein [Candidatus Acidoferrum sp.]
MSFREKTAWVTLCAIVIVTLMYWFHIGSLFEPHSPGRVAHSLGASLVAFLLIELVAYFVLRLRNPEDAGEPKDERERLIDLKAMRIAYYVFVVCALLGIFVALHVVNAGAGAVATTVMLAYMAAEVVRHSARIVFYRRGV